MFTYLKGLDQCKNKGLQDVNSPMLGTWFSLGRLFLMCSDIPGVGMRLLVCNYSDLP